MNLLWFTRMVHYGQVRLYGNRQSSRENRLTHMVRECLAVEMESSVLEFMNRNCAVFFDRDGTLMEDVYYCGDPAKVKVYAGVTGALRNLKEIGYRTVVVTNQSGIGRGLFTETQYRLVEAEFLRQVGEGLIDASYFCADVPGIRSGRRKPEPGMLLQAAADLQIQSGAVIY